MYDWQLDRFLCAVLDAEMDMRFIDQQLALRGELRVTNRGDLERRRAGLERDVAGWTERLLEESDGA